MEEERLERLSVAVQSGDAVQLEAARREIEALEAAERDLLVSRLALRVSDRQALAALLGADGDNHPGSENFYPDQEVPAASNPGTFGAIDTFLNTYGHGDDPAEQQLLERLIFHPATPDYAATLGRDLPQPTADDPDPLARFIATHGEKPQAPKAAEKLSEKAVEAAAPATAATPEQGSVPISPIIPIAKEEPSKTAPRKASKKGSPSSSTLSESLARIYIRQGRYSSAYEIIKRLYLAVPEKNAYFADQLRFLRKLMLIDEYRHATESKPQEA